MVLGIYLPDYDSSEFEVDGNARATAEILGVTFHHYLGPGLLLFNIKTIIKFAIIIIVIGVILYLIIIFAGHFCVIHSYIAYVKIMTMINNFIALYKVI